MGVIALEQKRYEDARRHFAAVLALDDKHSSSEAWRGLGAADLQLGKTEQALAELQKYTDRREFDPEGLYWLGAAFKKLGRSAEARDAFQRAVEAARTSPPHRRRYTSAWGRQAKAEMKTLIEPAANAIRNAGRNTRACGLRNPACRARSSSSLR